MLCLDPVQSNSVLSVFSLSLLADIQRPTSMMHSLSRVAAVVMSSRQQCRYNCVSSCRLIMSARSATYNTNSTGPRTEPCGTEQTTHTTDEVPPAYTTRYVIPNRYERNHIKAVPHRPNWRSSPSNISDRQCRRQLLNQVGRVLTPATCLRRAAGHSVKCYCWVSKIVGFRQHVILIKIQTLSNLFLSLLTAPQCYTELYINFNQC